MRLSPKIDKIWNQGGPFVGENAPNGYVLVENDWKLNTVQAGSFASKWNPIRWFQRFNIRKQDHRVVPNVKSITIDRSIDSDAAECEIVLLNVLPRYNESDTHPSNSHISKPESKQDAWGEPGGLTFQHGIQPEAQARWGHKRNEWTRVLRPGALLRTAQGYGSVGKDVWTALAEGSVVWTGIWRVDSVTPASNGDITLRCRDIASLLVDQIVYPPLVPTASYPLSFYRYVYSERKVTNPTLPSKIVNRRLTYRNSTADMWYGRNASIKGHRATHSLDGNSATYALSVGNSHPTRPFCADWWEYDAHGQKINQIEMHAWRGGYTLFVSVMEGGRWKGSQRIPFDAGPLLANQPGAINSEAGIPYVAKFSVPWEQKRTFNLPKVYDAQRIRVTFRNHTKSDWGPYYYRCGIREIKAKHNAGAPTRKWVGMVRAPSGYGFWAVSDKGDIEDFGDATKFNNFAGLEQLAGRPLRASLHYTPAMQAADKKPGILIPTSSGYIAKRGTNLFTPFEPIAGLADVCVDNGSATSDSTWTPYWTVTRRGTVQSHTGAPSYANIPTPNDNFVVRIASHPTASGFWALRQDGTVVARGAAVHHGSGVPGEAVDIIPNPVTGDGYYIMNSQGTFRGYGPGAPNNLGNITNPKLRNIGGLGGATAGVIGTTITSAPQGVGIMTAYGFVAGRKSWDHVGHPIGGQATRRRDGNYKDITDIVRLLLLWSGFYFQGAPRLGSKFPPIHGNIEATGFAPEAPFDHDFFDKKTVMEVINALKEITGYIFRVDGEGGVHYTSPNWWQIGNFLPDGTHTKYVRELEERHNLISHSPTQTLANERDRIIISDGDPLIEKAGVRSFTRPWKNHAEAEYLRGVVNPMFIPAPIELTTREMRLMADLVAIHMRFKRRPANSTAAAHPAIEPDDQIRIWERVSGETYTHYVRSVSTTQDFSDGTYTMDLNTHWLGNQADWVIQVIGGRMTRANVSLMNREDAIYIEPDIWEYATSRSRAPLEPEVGPSPDIDDIGDPSEDGAG